MLAPHSTSQAPHHRTTLLDACMCMGAPHPQAPQLSAVVMVATPARTRTHRWSTSCCIAAGSAAFWSWTCWWACGRSRSSPACRCPCCRRTAWCSTRCMCVCVCGVPARMGHRKHMRRVWPHAGILQASRVAEACAHSTAARSCSRAIPAHALWYALWPTSRAAGEPRPVQVADWADRGAA